MMPAQKTPTTSETMAGRTKPDWISFAISAGPIPLSATAAAMTGVRAATSSLDMAAARGIPASW